MKGRPGEGDGHRTFRCSIMECEDENPTHQKKIGRVVRARGKARRCSCTTVRSLCGELKVPCLLSQAEKLRSGTYFTTTVNRYSQRTVTFSMLRRQFQINAAPLIDAELASYLIL